MKAKTPKNIVNINVLLCFARKRRFFAFLKTFSKCFAIGLVGATCFIKMRHWLNFSRTASGYCERILPSLLSKFQLAFLIALPILT